MIDIMLTAEILFSFIKVTFQNSEQQQGGDANQTNHW
jgi:hypothetical protein